MQAGYIKEGSAANHMVTYSILTITKMVLSAMLSVPWLKHDFIYCISFYVVLDLQMVVFRWVVLTLFLKQMNLVMWGGCKYSIYFLGLMCACVWRKVCT
jgi:hypothetical protein